MEINTIKSNVSDQGINNVLLRWYKDNGKLVRGKDIMLLKRNGRKASDHEYAVIPFSLPEELRYGMQDHFDPEDTETGLLKLIVTALNIALFIFSRQTSIYIGYLPAHTRLAMSASESSDFPLILPLNSELSGDTCVSQLLRQVKEQLVANQAVSELTAESYDRFIRITNASLPLPSVVVLPDFSAEIYPDVEEWSTRHDLILSYYLDNGSLCCKLYYNKGKFDSGFLTSFKDSLMQLFHELGSAVDIELKDIRFTTNDQRKELYDLSMGEQRECKLPPLLYKLLEQNAEVMPDRKALIFEDEELSYAELNDKANGIANAVSCAGQKVNIVALCLERSVEMAAAIYGIQKTGAAYLPLDPGSPQSRLRLIIEEYGIQTVITSKKWRHLYNNIDINLIFVEDIDWTKVSFTSDYEPAPGDLAYVIFTSGSTGKPKGVAIAHESLSNRVDWMQNTYSLKQSDRVLQKTPFTFDVSVWEFFWPLMYGATLVIAPPEMHKDPGGLSVYIDKQRVSVLHFVPSALQSFLHFHEKGTNECLEKVFCSGEAISYQQIEEFRMHFPDTELHNLYGPTEAAIDVTAWDCSAFTEAATPPIGRPIQNMQCLILDHNYQLMPAGVTGDLFLSGIGLAKGYLNAPELTSASFIVNPFSSGQDSYQLMYRTGDVARYLPEGTIEYLGRSDEQVKIRGFRIELQEINLAIEEADFIDRAVTLKDEETLIAFVLPASHAKMENIDADAVLRRQLLLMLPDYMIPHHFHLISEIPLTSNGKADKDMLISAFRRSRELKKENKIIEERSSAGHITVFKEIWAEVLGLHVSDINPGKNFIEHGGDSLSMLKIIAKCKTAGISLSLKEFANSPYLSVIGNGPQVNPETSSQDESPADRSPATTVADFMLSPIQQWFFEKNETHRKFIMHASYYIDKNYSLEKLRSCFVRIYEKHESLRLMFSLKGGLWVQNYQQPDIYADFLYDLTHHPEVNLKWCIETSFKKINEQTGSQLYACVFMEGENPVLFIACHHLVMDSVSWQILMNDLEGYY